MAVFDQVSLGGGRGLFPYVGGKVNWNHPLAANLIFFAVPTPYGYLDLVRQQPMPHQIPPATVTPSGIQLVSQSPLNMAAWQYGNFNQVGSYAVTPGSQPSYQPSAGMSIAASCWSPQGLQGNNYSGTTTLLSASNGTDVGNTVGLFKVFINGTAQCAVSGGGGSTNLNADLTGLNTSLFTTPHCIFAHYSGSGTAMLCQRDNALSSTNTPTRAWSGIDRMMIGSPTGNNSGRPIFWAAAWNVVLSTSLRNMVTTGSADGNVSRNPLFGAIPKGLIIPGGKRWISL